MSSSSTTNSNVTLRPDPRLPLLVVALGAFYGALDGLTLEDFIVGNDTLATLLEGTAPQKAVA